MSVWAFLRAKKDKEGLNAAEMEQFNKLNQQLAAAETEFDVSTDFGQQLTAPQYETDITKSAAYTPIDFSGKDTPDLTIEANAEGGRIGYNMGGIDTPFQGIGALNPRMGYRLGEEVEQVTETVDMPENMQMAGTDTPPIELKNLQDLLEAFREVFGRDPASMDELKRWASQRAQGDQMQDIKGQRAGPDWFEPRIQQILEDNPGMSYEDAASQAYDEGQFGAAQGGRIGYQNASHPLDNIALQMFGDTFENLNPLQQITVSQSQSKAQGGRIGAQKRRHYAFA